MLIVMGIIPMTVGRLLMMPIPGGDHPEVAQEEDEELAEEGFNNHEVLVQ